MRNYVELTPETIKAKLERLKRTAKRATDWRGHTLGDWQDGARPGYAWSRCTLCGAYVIVIVNPRPNEPGIGGEAVAVGHVDLGHNHKENKAGRQVCCKTCHVCGTGLHEVLDGELWCPVCFRYR